MGEENLKYNLSIILCPTDPRVCKVVNKYIGILFNSRNLLDTGTPLDQLFFRNEGQFLGEDTPSHSDSFSSSLASEISFCESSEED